MDLIESPTLSTNITNSILLDNYFLQNIVNKISDQINQVLDIHTHPHSIDRFKEISYDHPEYPYPRLSDWNQFFLAFLIFFLIRPVLNHLIYIPIGKYFIGKKWKLREEQNTINNNTNIETSTTTIIEKEGNDKNQQLINRKISQNNKNNLSGNEPQKLINSNLSFKDEEKFNHEVKKFSESAWRFTYYSLSWLLGLYIGIKTDFFYDPHLYFKNWPYHPLPSDLKLYYSICFGYYAYCIFSVFIEVRRKDFAEMVFHHFVTVGLIIFSMVLRFYRIGFITLLLHDCNDIFLELGKSLKYLNLEKECDLAFNFFAISWLLTRFIGYPFLVIRTAMFTSFYYVIPYFWYFVGISYALLCLLGLHIYWGYLIAKIAIKAYVKKDGLSDSREEDDDDD